MSPKLIRLMFVATVVAGLSAPMMAAHSAPQRRSVDVYDPPKGFFVLGAPDPKVLEINPNDEVTWNIMEGEHTITPQDPKRWGDGGSDTLGQAESGTYVADNFKAFGDYAYYCKLHGGMSGIVRVVDNTPTTQPPTTQATAPPTTQPTAPPTTATTKPGPTPPATTATAPTTRPAPTAPIPAATATTAKPDKDKKKDSKDDETTTTSTTLPPPVDLPNEAIVPSLPGATVAPGSDAELPTDTPEGEALALLKAKKDGGGDAMKLLIVSGLGLGALGIGTAGYKYANRSSKYFPA